MEREPVVAADQAVKSCLESGEAFCPVSLRTYGGLFWGGMLLVSLAVVAFNVWQREPLLLALYAFPISFLAMAAMPRAVALTGAVVLIGTVPLFIAASPALWGVMAGLAAFYFVVRRVVAVSGRNFARKQANDETLMSTVLSFAKTIDARDPYTAYHSHNVAKYARQIAEELGLPGKQADAIYLAGLIHDIGKIGTPESILHKESRLTDEEYETMKKHAEDGYHIVKNMKALEALGIPAMVRHHHERPDGRGYPLQLRGADIPLGARILGVADAFDAMTTNRSYRQKLAIDTAAEELRRHMGTQFDPQATNAWLAVLRREGKLAEEPAMASNKEAAVASM